MASSPSITDAILPCRDCANFESRLVIAGIFITHLSLRLERNDDDYDSPPISLTKMPADKDEEEYRTTEFCSGS